MQWKEGACGVAACPGRVLAAPCSHPLQVYFSAFCGAPFVYHAVVHEKGTPVAKRGRKATGLFLEEAAGLPKGELEACPLHTRRVSPSGSWGSRLIVNA